MFSFNLHMATICINWINWIFQLVQDKEKYIEPPMQPLLETCHAFFIHREGTHDEALRTLKGRLKSKLNSVIKKMVIKKMIFLYVQSQTNDSIPVWELHCFDSLVLHNLWKFIQTEQCTYISLSHDKIKWSKSLNLAYSGQCLASVWYISNKKYYSIIYLHLLCFFFNRLNQELFLTTF